MAEEFEKEIGKYDTLVQTVLKKAWVTASSGYAHIYVIDFGDLVLVDMINKCGLTVNTHQKSIDWGFSTHGIGKQLRDQTYKCIKESIYPTMKVLAEKGQVTLLLESTKWLVNSERLLISGSDYFTDDGFECIIEEQFIIGFSWKYSTIGYANTLRRISELGFLNTYLPFLREEFKENPIESIEVPPELRNEKFTPRMIKYLKEKENIYLDNNRFYKKVIYPIASDNPVVSDNPTTSANSATSVNPTTSAQIESDQPQTNDSKQLRAMETDKS
jgi:hypothetical protein